LRFCRVLARPLGGADDCRHPWHPERRSRGDLATSWAFEEAGAGRLHDAAVGAYVANEPAPILALLPTEAAATTCFANRKIIIGSTPIFEDASPVLRS
jgi:hypothetical protein